VELHTRSGADLTAHPGGDATSGQQPERLVDTLRGDDRSHPDAHVQGPLAFELLHHGEQVVRHGSGLRALGVRVHGENGLAMAARQVEEHAAQFEAAKVPFIFDPGQGLPMFEAAELATFNDQATWVAVNDYEWGMLQQKTGLSASDIVKKVQALIVTRGAEGSVIYTAEGTLAVPAVKARAVVDPTGCGDAYRAGLIHGLLHGLDWQTTGRIAALMGAIKIESRGPQNHEFTRTDFDRRYRDNFG